MQEPTLTRRKKVFFSFLILLIFCLAAAAAEGALRIFAPGLRDSFFTRNVRLPYEEGFTGGHPVKLNRWRMRDVDFPVESPPGRRRIFCLGDSITFGYGLAAEDSWPKQLQARLAENGAGDDYFVVNGSGTGATPHRQLEIYEQFGRKLGAKVIIVGFCMNDVAPRGVLSDVGFAPAGKVAKSFEWRSELRRSYIFAAIDLTMTEVLKRYLYPLTGRSWLYAYPYQLNSFGVTEGSDRAWEETIETIGRMQRAVTQDGNTLIIAAFPYQFQISDHPRDNPYRIDKSRFTVDPFERLRQVTAREGILFVDLERAFREARRAMIDGKADWDPLFLDFCHPNARGQALAADRILEALRSHNLIEAP